MGLCRLITYAILGPLFIYLVLLGHSACRHFLQTPGPVSVQDFPREVSKGQKDSIIQARKPIIKDFLDTFGSKKSQGLFQHLTEDIDMEDPVQRARGQKELKHLVRVFQSFGQVESQIHGEHHGANEILMDWTLTMKSKYLPDIPIRMRSHFMLDKSSGTEKVFRYYEEWNGNKLITEKTTPIGPLGKVHANLRRFVGYLIVSGAEKGWY